jgi:hypothetical protein
MPAIYCFQATAWRRLKRWSDKSVKTNRKPRTRPLEVLADSAYDNVAIREYLRSRAIKSNIPNNTRNSKRRKRGRTTRFDEDLKQVPLQLPLSVVLSTWSDACFIFRF